MHRVTRACLFQRRKNHTNMLFAPRVSWLAPSSRRRKQKNRPEAASISPGPRHPRRQDRPEIPDRRTCQCPPEDTSHIRRRFSDLRGQTPSLHWHCCRQEHGRGFPGLRQKSLQVVLELPSHRRWRQNELADLGSRSSEFRRRKCCGVFVTRPDYLKLLSRSLGDLRHLLRCPRSSYTAEACGCLR